MQSYLGIVRVLVKSVILFHGQRKTLKMLILRSEHAYLFEKFSTVIKYAFTILNNNDESYS